LDKFGQVAGQRKPGLPVCDDNVHGSKQQVIGQFTTIRHESGEQPFTNAKTVG
jgi:hypothetical protein